jgi:hypothetical protein
MVRRKERQSSHVETPRTHPSRGDVKLAETGLKLPAGLGVMVVEGAVFRGAGLLDVVGGDVGGE